MEQADRGPGSREDALGAEEALLSAKLRQLFRDLDGASAGEDTVGEGDAPAAGELARPPGVERILGDFRVLRPIGAGGMATVFEAEQLSLHRRVALKILAPQLACSQRSVSKFQREAEAGGRPAHPGIVAIHAVGEADGVHYIAEELVGEGRTLADQIGACRDDGELPRGWFRRVAGQLAEVAEALAHAHDCEVIHRDVKPSNILLTEQGRPKVADFGLARIEDALALSRSGDLVGTPYYMSPEQALGKRSEIDHRTDVYSLGVTLYECLTLQRPFAGESTDEVLSSILLHDPPDPRRLDPRVPGDLAAICMQAMEKDPRRRYATMRALAEDLHRFESGEAVRAQPVGRLGRAARWASRRKVQVAGATLTLLAAAALVVLGLLLAAQRSESRRGAEARFVPLREALWQGRPGSANQLDKWHAQVTPGRPDGPMLGALVALARGDLEPAAAQLAVCLERCGPRGEEVLAADARYLLALVHLERARTAAPDDADRLRDLAGRELDSLGAFDPLERGALVWRERAPTAGVKGLRLDVEHRLVHLYMGIAAFEDLYKGGSPEDFRGAVTHLESVLAQRPDDEVATGLLARTLLFQARTYDLHHLLPEATALCLRANDLGGDVPFYLWNTTLGQVRLLYGDGPGALAAFGAARGAVAASGCDSHNVPLGFGRAYTLLDRPAEAMTHLEDAQGWCPGDPHSLLALTELCFASDPARARECARMAWVRPRHSVRDARSETGIAAAALAVARLCAASGDTAGAQAWLRDLADRALLSPRDFGQACQLALTLPAEELADDQDVDLVITVRMLVQHLEWTVDPLGGDDSAITWSGVGAGQVLLGLPADAVASLERARRTRGRWPAAVAAAQWADEARDTYVLALAHHALAHIDPSDSSAQRGLARERLAEADLLVAGHPPPSEQVDLLERLRAHAHSTVEGP